MLEAFVGGSGLFLDLELAAGAYVPREDRFGFVEEMGREDEGLLSLELLLGPGAKRLAHLLPSPW
jgi:hypothetical protein